MDRYYCYVLLYVSRSDYLAQVTATRGVGPLLVLVSHLPQTKICHDVHLVVDVTSRDQRTHRMSATFLE